MAGMRKYRPFADGSVRTCQLDPKHEFPSWAWHGRSAPESCRRRYGHDAPEPGGPESRRTRQVDEAEVRFPKALAAMLF
jgi:hypothetical protein